MLGQVLVSFLFRLATGLAAAMAVTPHRWVISGFFRIHLWVVMGMFTLAALVSAGQASDSRLGASIAAAVISYVGSALWLYERSAAGKAALVTVALIGAWELPGGLPLPPLWAWAEGLTSAAVLGFTTTAMLLGHWYLNSPTMKLAPLRRLIVAMMLAVVARAAVAAGTTWLLGGMPATGFEWAMAAIRWLAGVGGVLLVGAMAWQTLKIPNTQSATGILYVGVILAFLGELAALFPTFWGP